MQLDLISPFPVSGYSLVWKWLHEFPLANFDDYGPKSLPEFEAAMEERAGVERTWGVTGDGRLCGIIAYLPLSPRSGTFHGICFARAVHGQGIARAAVGRVLEELFASGAEKVSAGFFSDNQRIHRFLAGLGAVDEGLLRKHTLRGGIGIDMRMMAFFKGDHLCL